MNIGLGPDVLGVREVENRFLVDRLAVHGRRWCLSKANPLGGMGKPVNQNGFSDHFRVTTTITGST
jgi:hypothetical protein